MSAGYSQLKHPNDAYDHCLAEAILNYISNKGLQSFNNFITTVQGTIIPFFGAIEDSTIQSETFIYYSIFGNDAYVILPLVHTTTPPTHLSCQFYSADQLPATVFFDLLVPMLEVTQGDPITYALDLTFFDLFTSNIPLPAKFRIQPYAPQLNLVKAVLRTARAVTLHATYKGQTYSYFEYFRPTPARLPQERFTYCPAAIQPTIPITGDLFDFLADSPEDQKIVTQPAVDVHLRYLSARK